MFALKLSKLFVPPLFNICVNTAKQCHGVFGIKKLIHREKPKNYDIQPLAVKEYDAAIKLLKEHYLPHHVLVQARRMDLTDDRAIDEYIEGLFKQGNSLCLKDKNGEMVGLCVNYATSPVDPNSLRNYAFYRQNPNTKDFLYFTAKLQETPNLWNVFKESKIFEMKMLTVKPEHRRQGLAVMLTERAKELADDQAYSVMRMNCINPYDYKIAERCMLQCLAVFPIHRLRGPNAPFVKKSSEYNRRLRVYVKCPKACPRLDEAQILIEEEAMVRNRIRKTSIGFHSEIDMREAMKLVENGKTLREAANMKNVNFSTLYRYYENKKANPEGKRQISTRFTMFFWED